MIRKVAVASVIGAATGIAVMGCLAFATSPDETTPNTDDTVVIEPAMPDVTVELPVIEPTPNTPAIPAPESTLSPVPPLVTEPVTSPVEVIVELPDLAPVTLIPCPTEDSDNCYWDAARMGNGTGTSFVTLNGVTYYPR